MVSAVLGLVAVRRLQAVEERADLRSKGSAGGSSALPLPRLEDGVGVLGVLVEAQRVAGRVLEVQGLTRGFPKPN